MLSRLPTRTLAKAILPRLHYLPVIGRSYWRKFWDVRQDLERDPVISRKPPYLISLRITNRCNQRCAICGQFGDNGYMHEGLGDHLLTELKFNDYKRIVDETAHYKPIFYITGGEALLYPELFKLTAYMKSKGCFVYVITNGALLERYADSIVDQRWDLLTCSLDGPEDVHDACRGIPGTFRKTTAGLKKILNMRGRGSYPYLAVSATVSSRNQHRLNEMFDTVAEVNPDALLLYLSWFTSSEQGREHARILKEELDVDAHTWQSYIGQNREIDTDQLRQTLRKVSRTDYPFGWFTIPRLKDEHLEPYYREPENFLGFGPCLSPYTMIDIMPNGDVTTCRDYIDVKVGNVTEKPLLEIWNDTGFQEWRKLLHKHDGTLPQCSRCCGLMGF